MRARVARLLVVGLVAASGCSSDSPSAPSTPSTPTTTLRAIAFDAPSLIILGDAPVPLQARVELGDGSVVDVAKVKCTASWTSSAPAYATAALGTLEARSVGDATIAVTCRELRAERVVRVRRRLTGTVIASDNSEPIPGAVLSIVSGPDAGVGTRADNAGRFTMAVPAAFDLQVSATGFDSVRRGVEATEGAVQLALRPKILEFRWEGVFETWAGLGGKRLPEGLPDGLEFETHRTGEVSLALFASCNTGGTYDDFEAWVWQGSQWLFSASPLVGANRTARASRTLPAGNYRLTLSRDNAYARTGCTWWFELTRPY